MLEELKTFTYVVQYKNFTKAAHALHLSQPSVSAHIKYLEQIFGTSLVNRSVKQKGITITQSGYHLYSRAKEILELIELTQRELKEHTNTLQGHLKVGASSTIGEYVLPQFLSYFNKKYPKIIIEVSIGNTTKITHLLKDLVLDIGLIEGVYSSSYFTQSYFLTDPMVIALPTGHSILDKPFSFNKLQNQSWIVREEGSGTREYMDQFLSMHQIVPKSLSVFGSNYAVKEAVRNGLGLTIISHFVAAEAQSHGELSTIPLDSTFDRHFSYLLPKSIKESHIIDVFLEELIAYTRLKESQEKPYVL